MEHSYQVPIHIEILLDGSHSMYHYRHDTLKGFNKFIELQQQEDTADFTTCTINYFSEDVVVEKPERMPLLHVKQLNNYEPKGNCTALYYAIKNIIGKLKTQLNDWKPKPIIIVAVITDGYDNASNKIDPTATPENIKNIIQASDWNWIFMGALNNVKEEAEKIGITKYQQFDQEKKYRDLDNPELTYTGTEFGMIELSRNVSTCIQDSIS